MTRTRLRPGFDTVDWSRSACRDLDRDMFFSPSTEDEALSVCRSPCPIRLECLNYALLRPEQYGVWGGLTEAQRRVTHYTKHRVRCPGCAGAVVDRTLAGTETCALCGLSWRV